MPPRRPLLYLIDASSYVYRAFHALPPLTTPKGLPIHAVYGFATMVLKLLRETDPQYLAAVFDTPGPTFRDRLLPSYKAHRPPMPDDLASQFPLVFEVTKAFQIRCVSVDGVEADDVIATITDAAGHQKADTVVITADKDLMQLVGDHVQLWDTMKNRRIDAAAVRARFGVEPAQIVDLIGLMGDSSDNIPGVKGIGEKTAATLIQRFGTVDNLLERLDELESATDIRGARKLAATLRADPESARLSRELATVRRDVPLDCSLEGFRFRGSDPVSLREVFSRLGFQRLLRELPRPTAPAAVAVECADSAEDAAARVAAARHQPQVAIAAVTGDDNRAAGIVFTHAGTSPAMVPLPLAAKPITELLSDPGVEKVAHDLKQDLLLLRAAGVADVQPGFDVMVASYLLEASPTHRLEDLAADVSSAALPAYRGSAETLAAGVALLPELRERFAGELRQRELEHLFREVEMPLVGILADMERHGIRLDLEAFARMSREIEARMRTTMDDIHAMAGGEFNILSPQQLREVLFERLRLSTKGVRRGKTGLSTDVDVLTRLAADHPLPGKILEYRALAKLKSTYIDALPAAVNPTTGRLHTSFNQTVAATGRLSSSNPNLQNIPIRGEDGKRIRGAFVADDGCVLISADYSQIELRVLAHLSEDPALVEAFRRDEDVHTRTATAIFHVLPGLVTADMRRAAKVINFGILYGMGAPALARELNIQTREAERWIVDYFSEHARVRAYLDAAVADARRRGYAVTLLGRRRSLPDLASKDRNVAQAAERVAANTPIQGSAADIIKVAMVGICRRLRKETLAARLLLQVHDELLFEVPEAEAERLIDLVREEMEQAFALHVPLRVEIGQGRNWAEAH